MRLKNNKTAGTDGLPTELLKTVCNELVGLLQNMTRGQYAQRLELLFCPEKETPYDMRQLHWYKPSPYRI